MSEFKLDDKVTVTASNAQLKLHGCSPLIKSGNSYIVTEVLNGFCELSHISCGFVEPSMIELVAPKWSIYNNDLPWEKLSNKQKGKMLLAAHSGVKFEGVMSNPPAFDCEKSPYTAVKPEPVKPAMAELFVLDWAEQDSLYKINVANHMIAIGWNKPC